MGRTEKLNSIVLMMDQQQARMNQIGLDGRFVDPIGLAVQNFRGVQKLFDATTR